MAGRIILACKRGDWLMVEQLLPLVKTEGLDTNLVTEGVGWTPIHFAAKDNRVSIVSQLIDCGYNVNAKGKVRPWKSCLHVCPCIVFDRQTKIPDPQSSILVCSRAHHSFRLPFFPS